LLIDRIIWRWTRGRSALLARLWYKANGSRGGRASVALGGDARIEHMRAIAAAGGRAAVAAGGDTRRAHMKSIAAMGGRASWAALSPQEAADKRRRAWNKALSSMTHEQRVANGKRAMELRWQGRQSS
jgi:hypothetical protein